MTIDHTEATSPTPRSILSFAPLKSLPNLQPTALFRAHSTGADKGKRLLLSLVWLLLVAWLLNRHVMWRDEVRAFTFALSGASVGEMLRNIHGEGHPALWYLLLRAAHDVFPVRQVLPVTGAIIGIGTMALFAFRAPFRLAIVALVLFSLFGAFEYVVTSRNYGISALVMFVLAALYPRVKGTPWFGLILLILCNTNVPSCILAAAFLLFRFVEMLTDEERPAAREWLILFVNGAFALAGALLCFITVYPPLNGGAVSPNLGPITATRLLEAVGANSSGFSYLVLNLRGWVPVILLWASCLVFIRKPAALMAGVAALLGLKLFFYFVYPSGYRHEALFVVFLLSLLWMCAEAAGGRWRERNLIPAVATVGTLAFLLLLIAQTLDLAKPLYQQMKGVPYSRSGEVAQLLKQRSLSGAVVMADPDVLLEPLPYYADSPLWFLREGRFGKVFLKSRSDRHLMSLDTVLGDAEFLHRKTGRPVVFLSQADLGKEGPRKVDGMYRDLTVLDPPSVARFGASTRLIAHLRPAMTDEAYDVYVYPR